FYADYFIAVFFFISLKPFQYFRNIFFGGLVFCVNRNTVFIVPNAHYHWHLQNSGSIYGFPEKAFAGACISNGSPRNFVSVDGEIGFVFNSLYISENL